jgi:hypothetical protein
VQRGDANQNYSNAPAASNSDNGGLIEQEITIQTLPAKLHERNHEDFEAGEYSKHKELMFIKEQNRHLQEKLHQLHLQNERYKHFLFKSVAFGNGLSYF